MGVRRGIMKVGVGCGAIAVDYKTSAWRWRVRFWRGTGKYCGLCTALSYLPTFVVGDSSPSLYNILIYKSYFIKCQKPFGNTPHRAG